MNQARQRQKSKADVVVLDWGIGGLSVYCKLKKAFPHLRIIYFSDSGSRPYGTLTRWQMSDRLMMVLRLLSTQYGVFRFVIACNAASTALPDLQSRLAQEKFEVIGMLEPTLAWLTQDRKNVLKTAFIGGKRTVRSGILQRRSGIVGRVAQPLSAQIEAGVLTGPVLHRGLQQILLPLKKMKTLILSCTHYPAIAEEIQKHLPQTKLIDPADFVIKKISLEWRLSTRDFLLTTRTLFLTTGSVLQSNRSAKLAFQVKTKFKSFQVD